MSLIVPWTLFKGILLGIVISLIKLKNIFVDNFTELSTKHERI